MRQAQISRKTNETDIKLALNLDGNGIAKIDTGCGFLNHMLELFAKHARYDLEISCKGDINVDFHHTTEDVAIVLGKAFNEALGDKKGISSVRINRQYRLEFSVREIMGEQVITICRLLDISNHYK